MPDISTTSVSQCACVISVPRDRSFDQSLIDLLSCYFSTAAGAPSSLERLIATGYISRAQFELLLQRVLSNDARREREQQAWSKQARENETGIIRVARELGLRPEPAGIGPVQWYANCPHTRPSADDHDRSRSSSAADTAASRVVSTSYASSSTNETRNTKSGRESTLYPLFSGELDDQGNEALKQSIKHQRLVSAQE